MKQFVGVYGLLELETISKETGEFICPNGHKRRLGYFDVTRCELCQEPYIAQMGEYYPNGVEVLGDDDNDLIDLDEAVMGLPNHQMIVISNTNDGTRINGFIITLNPDQINLCVKIFTQKYDGNLKGLPYVKGYKILFGAFCYDD